MKKISFLKIMLLAVMLVVGMKSVNAATFTSIATGNWNVAGTWDQGAAIPTSTDDIVIASGHSITLNASSSCNNLTINTTGLLSIAGNGLTTTGNINISGTLKGSPNANSSSGTWTLSGSGPTVTIDGTLGGTGTSVTTGTGEGVKIVLGFATNTTATFQGSGIVNISHFYSSNIVANQNTIIDINMNIKNVLPATTNVPFGLQNGNNGANSTKVITINSGKTIILNNQYTFFHSLTSGGSSSTGGTMTYNINGTLDVRAGQFNLSTNSNSTSNLVTVNVGASGKIILGSTVCLNTNLLGQIPPSIALNSGSIIEFAGSISPTIITSAASGATPPTFPWNNLSNLIINNSAGVTLSSNTNSETLTINPSAILNVNPAKQLTVSTTLTNNGALNLLSTDADGTATILTPATIGGTTGTVSVQQYLSSVRNWYMSSPVIGATAPTGNTYYKYVEALNNGTTWTPVTAAVGETPGDAFSKMTGYIVQPTIANPINFNGSSLYTGDQSISGLTMTATAKTGFNLVGNPYPSYVDWNQATKTNLSNTMWYRTYDGSAWKFYTYNTVDGAGIGVPASVTNLIPPMQAFWVKVTSGIGTLGFANTSRSHKVDASVFRAPAAKTSVNQILRLQVAAGSITDEAVVYFNPNASNGFDAYDSPKMMNGSTSTAPDIYTTAGTEQLVINGMNTIPYDVEIPLYFKANASSAGPFSLSSPEMSNFDTGTKVYVKNNKTGEQQIISDGTVYTFDATAVGSDPSFSLIFKAPGAITGIPTAANDQNLLVYRNANNQIAVQIIGQLNDSYSLDVYNSVGQRLASKQTTAGITIMDAPQSGVYFVTIKGNGNNTTKKVVIN